VSGGDASKRLLAYAMLGASVNAQVREGQIAAVVERVMCAEGWVCNPADHEGIPQPGECIDRMTAHAAGPLATAALAAIAATQRTDVERGRVREEAEVNFDALMEQEAEERAWWRTTQNRPL
jgi:hypothetical protein